MEEKVIHEKDKERFVIYLDRNEVYVEYTIAEKEINLYHTFTHPELRGKGLAAQVVRAALDFARENNLQVIPTCSYVHSFISKNGDYTDLISK